jgi:phenylalanyl-tRNA synthetase alpha chain
MYSTLRDQALIELQACSSKEALQDFHARYLGKNGLIGQQYRTMKDLSPEEKKTAGQDIQALQQAIEDAFFSRQESLQELFRTEAMQTETIDRSTPGILNKS